MRPNLFALLLLFLLARPVLANPLPDVDGFEQLPDGVRFVCQKMRLEVRFVTPDVVRVRAVRTATALAHDHSWALDVHERPPVAWTVSQTAQAVTLKSHDLQVVVDRSPVLLHFLDSGGRVIDADAQPMTLDDDGVQVCRVLGFDEHFYGMGEKAAHLDKRRGNFTMWTTDNPGWTYGSDPLYHSIPFYIGWQLAPAQRNAPETRQAFGIFFDNSYKSHFDFGNSQNQYVLFGAEGGDINYYFMAGPSMKHVLASYTDLTGRIPMPPAWTLGNQQCRWSYYPDTLVEQLVHRYRQEHLPLDAVHLDIHYMNEYRVFTWDTTRFPDPSRLAADLLQQGVHLVTIIDPGVKHQPGGPVMHESQPELAPQDQSYYVYQQGEAQDFFLKHRDGTPYIGQVWPGDAVFVDYTIEAARRWWGDLHRALLDHGVAGIWNDMNEPADFVDKPDQAWDQVVWDDNGEHSPYARMRNLFALLEARATFEGMQRLKPGTRPFVISRSGFAGIQRYATMWTGDNQSTWDSLSISIPEFMSLGLSGLTFVGADIGGFSGRCDGELLTRWYQLGFLTPLCRNHHAIDGYDQEPWRFGTPYENIIRHYLQLRYRLMPYLYTVLEEAHRTGMPWFRPLVLEFPDDDNTVNVDDEVMIGDALLLAPVTRPGARERDVYLPPGRWYDFYSGKAIEGGRLVTMAAPLDRVPLLVRGGRALPMSPVMDYVGQHPLDPLTWRIFPAAGGQASGTLYEDDGNSPGYLQGQSARTTLSLAAGRIRYSGPQGPYRTPSRQVSFDVVGHPMVAVPDARQPRTVTVP